MEQVTQAMEEDLGRRRAPGPHPARPRTWGALLGLTLLVAAAYGQTAVFDLVSDDHLLLVANPALRGRIGWWDVLTSPSSAFLGQEPGADRMYRPLLALSVAVDRAIWGMRPGGFHLSSVLAHLAAVILLWHIAWRMTGSAGAAFAAGAALAVHPSAVEAVAFISARMDVFVGLAMAGVVLLLRGSLAPGAGWRTVGALLAFALALASKETAAAIPAMVTWAAWVFPEWFAGAAPGTGRTRLAPRVACFWIVLGAYGVLRRAIIGGLAPVPIHLADLPAQALRAMIAVASYGRMTLLSLPATGYYRVAPPAGPADGQVLLGLALAGLLLAGLLWLRRRLPAAAFALGWYGAALVPASNLLPIYGPQAVYVAERSLYPALVGWCLFLAVGGHALLQAAGDRLGRSRRLVWAVGSAVAGTFLIVAVAKVGAWRDDVALWTASLVSDPGNALAHINLGAALARAGDLEGAEAAAREAVGRFPEDPRPAYLAGWLAELRDAPGEALRQYERSIALGIREGPAFRQAALLSARLKERDRAGRWFAAGADLFPRAAWPEVGLGWYLARTGRADLAQGHLDRAAQLEPNSPERPWFLGQLLAAEGDIQEADRAYRTALALDPSFVPARRELALMAEREGRRADAIADWRRIADALPGSHRVEAEEHLRRLQAAAPASAPRGAR